MVKVSHAKCRNCGASRHRNSKRNLCQACWLKVKPQVVQNWREIKLRRSLKRNGVTHAEEGALIVAAAVEQTFEEVHPEMPRGRAPTLTPEQEQEIVNLYTTTDTPVTEIAKTYEIGDTVPYRVLTKHGIAWRRGDTHMGERVLPPHIEAMKEVHVAPTPAPEPEPKAVLADKYEPITPTALDEAIRNGQPEVVFHQWRVEYVGTPFVNVTAESFTEAAAEAQRLLGSDVEIVLVRRLA